VGNWPGKTIERKNGYLLHAGWEIEVVDLPGTYSLTAYSAEESIVRDYFLLEKPDLVLAVLDACNLERHLYLVLQILEMRSGVLVALNRGDIAEKQGIQIDTGAMSQMLAGAPVLQIAAQRGMGIDELKDALVRAYQRRTEQLLMSS
jgi:ferrous iron transport protein B